MMGSKSEVSIQVLDTKYDISHKLRNVFEQKGCDLSLY